MPTMLMERPRLGVHTPPVEDAPITSRRSLVHVEDTDRAFVAYLARPEKCNAISLELIRELDLLVQRFKESGRPVPFVLRGTGKWFSSGGDLHQFSSLTPDEAVTMADLMTRLLRGIESLPGPTVAALNGPVIGGGIELALAFDLRVASASSFLRFAQTRMGITTGWQGIERLCRLVGYSTALHWLLTGKQVSAETAERTGLVNAAWPDDVFDAELDRFIDSLVDAGEAGLAIKRVLREGAGRCQLSSGELELQLLRVLWERPERQSAMKKALNGARSRN